MKDEIPELPYWSQLNDSISLAMALGLTNNDRFNFQDTSIEESKRIRQSIVTAFEKIILERDQMGTPRQQTARRLGSHAQQNLYYQSSIPMKKPTNTKPPIISTDSILEAIKRAEQNIKEGKVYTHAQAKEKLKKWLKA